ncbi:hypothetical protein F2Q69_00058282 [Brassica cretica]|uniref:Uncharacterized protein n=1 Tax=Brassica cretica TaxID=69181 RepID=A0A8S9RLT4_BRACR|nr:hypothetical protein F2Q69_00058282 [Brassica cretica]
MGCCMLLMDKLIPGKHDWGLKGDSSVNDIGFVRRLAERACKWSPATLDEVAEEKINLVFEPLEDDIELHIPETEENRWGGKYETSGFA